MEGTTTTLEARLVELERDQRRQAAALVDLAEIVTAIVRDLTPFNDDPAPFALQVAS